MFHMRGHRLRKRKARVHLGRSFESRVFFLVFFFFNWNIVIALEMHFFFKGRDHETLGFPFFNSENTTCNIENL